MNKTKTKSILVVIRFIALLCLSHMIGTLHRWLPDDFALLFSMTYILSSGIYIGLFISWTISIYKRIMQSHVRIYLMMIGINILFWMSVRVVKWGALSAIALADRLAWYMYYIPMVIIPLLFFFTALCVGEDENYKPNKKWNLLFIPTILLILLVLTNDWHMLVFKNFDLSIRPYGQSYDYGVGYFTVISFIGALLILSVVLIIKKFSSSVSTRKASRLPVLVFAGVVVYTALHILKPAYGIGHYFLDVTMFACCSAIAFWEACIRTGLIHSNMGHKHFFVTAHMGAQVVDTNGKAIYKSENARPLSEEDFELLKNKKSIPFESGTLINMSPIRGGYVVWSSDVSQIRSLIAQLEYLNQSLHEEVGSLTFENAQKREGARLKKLGELQHILLHEALPYSEEIKNTFIENKDASLEDMKRLLFETSMVSTYLKRKVNLILTDQTEKCISTEEMRLAFSESFQLLNFYGKTCAIHMPSYFDMQLNVAMLCYDLYQKILEKSQYTINTLYITFQKSEGEIVFTIAIDGDRQITASDFEDFETKMLLTPGAKLNFSDEGEHDHISLTFPIS